MVVRIWQKWGTKINCVLICSVLPRPDKETELENEMRIMNIGYAKAAREPRKHYPIAANTAMLSPPKLFLERFKYFDFGTGHTAYHT